jgi:hypothetical protein
MLSTSSENFSELRDGPHVLFMRSLKNNEIWEVSLQAFRYGEIKARERGITEDQIEDIIDARRK